MTCPLTQSLEVKGLAARSQLEKDLEDNNLQKNSSTPVRKIILSTTQRGKKKVMMKRKTRSLKMSYKTRLR